MRKDLILEIEAEFSEQRAANERTEQERKDKIRTAYPEIQHLVEERESLIHNAIRGILNRQENTGNIPSRMEELNRRSGQRTLRMLCQGVSEKDP